MNLKQISQYKNILLQIFALIINIFISISIVYSDNFTEINETYENQYNFFQYKHKSKKQKYTAPTHLDKYNVMINIGFTKQFLLGNNFHSTHSKKFNRSLYLDYCNNYFEWNRNNTILFSAQFGIIISSKLIFGILAENTALENISIAKGNISDAILDFNEIHPFQKNKSFDASNNDQLNITDLKIGEHCFEDNQSILKIDSNYNIGIFLMMIFDEINQYISHGVILEGKISRPIISYIGMQNIIDSNVLKEETIEKRFMKRLVNKKQNRIYKIDIFAGYNIEYFIIDNITINFNIGLTFHNMHCFLLTPHGINCYATSLKSSLKINIYI